MKVLIKEDPYQKVGMPFYDRGHWDAKWINHPNTNNDISGVYGYFLDFNLEEDKTIRIHVTADQRYKLWLDGEKIGLGSERGDNKNWFYETYELNLTKGKHSFFAFTWFIAYKDLPPIAQVYWKPGFLLACEDLPKEILNTGFASWKSISLNDFYKINNSISGYVGNRFDFHGENFPFGYENGKIGNWKDAEIFVDAEGKVNCYYYEFRTKWYLRPAILPEPYENKVSNVSIVFAEEVENNDNKERIIDEKNNLPDICNKFNDLLNNKKIISIDKNKKYRIVVDLNNYYCIFHKITTTSGKDSQIRLNYAESLGNISNYYERGDKGNRNEVFNKYISGFGDTMYPGGLEKESFECPWWMPGRFLEIYVETKDNDLVIDEISLTETHYDYKMDMEFDCNDDKYTNFISVAKRALEMCSHETYMDCPYYEQLMYVGDTRLEVLTSYALDKNRFLPKKALDMFHKSIGDNGLTQSRYPCNYPQHIPTFSLWYVAMIYDYAMWTNDINYVKDLMPSARAIIDYFMKHVNKDGLLVSPKGWNFTDWVPGFPQGMTKETDCGISGYYNVHLMYTLDLISKLENIINEPQLANRYKEISDKLYTNIEKYFWNEERGMFADNLEHDTWWEHTQCIATLSDHAQDKVDKMMTSLNKYDDIARTTIYYSHYLFEATKKAGYFDTFGKQINFWDNLVKQGFKTTPEEPEPSRSDCHAWGAHPIYHLVTGILGINPLDTGFNEILIKPNLLDLEWAKGKFPHRQGLVEVDFKQSNGVITGEVTLPNNLTGIGIFNGKEIKLNSGKNII